MEETWIITEDTCVLELACRDADCALMKDLLGDGLDPNYKKNNRPILQRATGYGNNAVVVLLTQHGAIVDANNGEELDAVEYAIRTGENDLARYLVREGKYGDRNGRIAMDVLEGRILEKKIEEGVGGCRSLPVGKSGP